MKRFVLTVACVLTIFLASSIISMAASVEYHNVDFSSPYDAYEFSGAMQRVYNPGGILSDGKASTHLSITSDMQGYASCTATGINNAQNTTTVERDKYTGWIKTPDCSVAGQKMFKKVNHYGRRYLPDDTLYYICNVYVD